MSDMQETIDAITARYQPEIDQLQQEGQKIQADFDQPNTTEAMVGAKFKVTWEDKDIIFDLPELTMKNERIVLDLPTVTTKRERIVFDTPSTRMVNKKVGQYPEVHGWTIKWKDIITKVPEVFMERQEIIYDLPQVRMDRKEMDLKIPQFSMKRVRWVIKLPRFEVQDVSAEIDKVKARGEDLKSKGEALAARMRSEIEIAVAAFTGPLAQEGNQVREQVTNSFSSAIGTVSKAIDDLTAHKLDPIKVPMEDGSHLNLRKTYDELLKQRDRMVGNVDHSLAQFSG